jgi:hypothetical protein
MDTKDEHVLDPVAAILAATFGPGVGAEVAAEENGAAVALAPIVPAWWKRNQDGSLRKTSQAPTFTGFAREAKTFDTDKKLLVALLSGAETVAEITKHSGLARLTIRRSLERLTAMGLVVMIKAPPTGLRGRRAYLYRALTEEPSVEVP